MWTGWKDKTVHISVVIDQCSFNSVVISKEMQWRKTLHLVYNFGTTLIDFTQVWSLQTKRILVIRELGGYVGSASLFWARKDLVYYDLSVIYN